MRHDADRRLKFRLLQRRLQLPSWQIKGLLTAIWHFTIENAPRGDIGRFTDEEIAVGIEYDGDAAQLIEGLVSTRWLDRCRTYRLVVHDWHEHCEVFVRKRLERKGISFVTVHGTSDAADSEMGSQRQPTADSGSQRQPTADSGVSRARAKPNPTQPNPTQEPPKPPLCAADAAPSARSTWLSPYLSAWTDAYGGQLGPGKAARALAAVREHLGDQEALARWSRYLAASDARYANPQRFAETHGEYANGAVAQRASRASPYPSTLSAAEKTAAANRRLIAETEQEERTSHDQK